MLVKDFKSQSKLPIIFLNSLEDYCNCGYPNDVNNTLTKLICTNPKCNYKKEQRVISFLQQLGIQIRDNLVTYIVSCLVTMSPCELFVGSKMQEVLEKCSKTDSYMLEEVRKLQVILENKKKDITLQSYIDLLSIPELQNKDTVLIVSKLLSNVYIFYKELRLKGLAYIQEQLKPLREEYKAIDIKEGNTVFIEAVYLYEVLLAYEEEIVQPLHYISLVK